MLGGSVHVLFSVKANPFLTRTALEYADGIEVCSFGEIKLAASCAECTSKITFGGICKEENDWNLAFSVGIRRFSVESLTQLQALEKVAASYAIPVSALIRISSGNQFGMDIAEAQECFRKSKFFRYVKILGVHYYPGTMRKVKEIDTDFSKLKTFLNELSEFNFDEVEYGAGIGIDYFGDSSPDDTMGSVAEKINWLAHNFQVSYEAGRFLSADAGIYITRVIELKRIEHTRYVILNGGRHQFTYHGGLFTLGRTPRISVVQHNIIDEKGKFTIVGALCSASDILVKEIEIPIPQIGDYIVFHKAGAYCATEGMALFLSRDIPAIFLLQDGEFRLARKKTGNIG
jgi:diaminopimelate decarboxylase